LSSSCALWDLRFEIQTLYLYVVNVLIKGEKSSGWYLGLICDESLTCRGLKSNPRHFGSFNFILVSCGESRLLISWCVGSRCDMTDGDGDLAGVGDLFQRIENDQPQVGYSVAGRSGGRMTPCVVYIMHM
jgi:hypothetical protein